MVAKVLFYMLIWTNSYIWSPLIGHVTLKDSHLLKSLQVDRKGVGHLLVPIILKIIPESISLEYKKERSLNSEFYVRELIDFIKIESKCRETKDLLHSSKVSKNMNFSVHSRSETNKKKIP